jgi:uncharacterized protein YdaU (DUF1376 family)
VSLAYFPFYVDRYEGDTAHLSMLDDGAYNRLLRLCWRSPGCKIPDDRAWIYRQMRATSDADRAAIDAVLAEYFRRAKGKTWSQKLLEIYEQVSDAHRIRSEAGKQGVAAKALKRANKIPSNAEPKLKQPEPEPEPKEKEQQPRAEVPSSQADATTRERLLAAMGADPISGLIGPNGRRLGTVADTVEAEKWSAMGISLDRQCAVIAERCAAMRRNNPHWTPGRFAYFTGAMADLAAAKAAPVPTGTARGQSDRDAKLARYAKIAGGTP